MASPDYPGWRGIAAVTRSTCSLPGILIALTLLSTAALAQNPSPAALPEANAPLALDVIAGQLASARTQTQPSLGASVYQFSRPAIENQPQGDNAPLNQ